MYNKALKWNLSRVFAERYDKYFFTRDLKRATWPCPYQTSMSDSDDLQSDEPFAELAGDLSEALKNINNTVVSLNICSKQYFL